MRTFINKNLIIKLLNKSFSNKHIAKQLDICIINFNEQLKQLLEDGTRRKEDY